MRGVEVSALTLSPDGRVLYLAFDTGGAGYQPGGVLALNVDRYGDADVVSAGLQSNLATYLTPVTSLPSPLVMSGAGLASGGDEPSALGVSRNGKYLYTFNGGLTFFTSIDPDQLDPTKYTDLMGGAGFGSAAATAFTGGLSGVTNAVNTFGARSGPLNDQLRLDLRTLAQTGVVFLTAPGFTGVFDVSSSATSNRQRWLFPSDLGTGWNPPPTNAGSIINHLTFGEVYVARPYGMAMRRDGRRAIVPLFQTGNFGVLDLDVQKRFKDTPNPANPVFGTLPEDMFHGFVAVTPAIELDPSVWPKRGAFRSFGEGFVVPSPDDVCCSPGKSIMRRTAGLRWRLISAHGRPPARRHRFLTSSTTQNNAFDCSISGLPTLPGARRFAAGQKPMKSALPFSW